MPVTGMQFGSHWVRNFGGSHSYSVTVQVPGVNAVCDMSLYSKWVGGERHHAADCFITQIVSQSGVENFPPENLTTGHLVPLVYRRKVTSVTFKTSVYKAKGMGRWIIYHWA
jgi:hypothetical protein